MNNFCKKITIGFRFLLILFGFYVIIMGLGELFYALFSQEAIINGDFNKGILGASILIVIILLGFGISYIISYFGEK